MQTIITAKRRGIITQLCELWKNRELVLLLAWRDFRVRYAQTVIGVAWAVFNPLVNLLLLTFVFNRVAQVGTEGIPPLLYGAAGLVAWTFFAEGMGKSGESLLANQGMVRKIYFPRLALPLSAVLASLPDLLISLLLVFVLFLFTGHVVLTNLWGLLLLLPLLFLAALTAGIWVSALTIRFRDFRFIVPVLLRLGLFLVPIAYPISAIPTAYRTAYFLNPLAGLVAAFKWCLLGLPAPEMVTYLGLPVLVILFLTGLIFFYRVESLAADHL